MTTYPDPIAESALFAVEQPPPVSLADKFGVPPMSVLDRRAGDWQGRKRKWLSLGIRSEMGRSEHLTRSPGIADPDSFRRRSGKKDADCNPDSASGTSIFDPVLCELVYRWHTRPGARILDPFAGGSVRGVVASTLGRWYDGIELRPEQVLANRAQAHLGSDITPRWIEGDATRVTELVDDGDYDLMFSCPPYADLEVYSDDPRDLSAMPYADFIDAYRAAIHESLSLLRRDRFAAWVISDVRDKRGAYRGLVGDTVRAFADAGAVLHNDAVLVDPIASASARAERPFRATRKLTRVHQHLLIFVKGDARRATRYAAGDAA